MMRPLGGTVAAALLTAATQAADPEWVASMTQAHARFAGTPGTRDASKGGPICICAGACPVGRLWICQTNSMGTITELSQGVPVGRMRPTTVRLCSCSSCSG